MDLDKLSLRAIMLAMLLLCGCSTVPSHTEAPLVLESGDGGEGGNFVNLGGKTLSERQIITAMNCATAEPSCRFVAVSGGAVSVVAVQPAVKVSFDQIQFDFDRDTLTPGSREALSVVAGALKSPQLVRRKFEIEGHTDAQGTLNYNMDLSKRRAESVRRYLIEKFKIDPSRLVTVGKGPTDLLDKNNPKSGVNRRVVFVREAIPTGEQGPSGAAQ